MYILIFYFIFLLKNLNKSIPQQKNILFEIKKNSRIKKAMEKKNNTNLEMIKDHFNTIINLDKNVMFKPSNIKLFENFIDQIMVGFKDEGYYRYKYETIFKNQVSDKKNRLIKKIVKKLKANQKYVNLSENISSWIEKCQKIIFETVLKSEEDKTKYVSKEEEDLISEYCTFTNKVNIETTSLHMFKYILLQDYLAEYLFKKRLEKDAVIVISKFNKSAKYIFDNESIKNFMIVQLINIYKFIEENFSSPYFKKYEEKNLKKIKIIFGNFFFEKNFKDMFLKDKKKFESSLKSAMDKFRYNYDTMKFFVSIFKMSSQKSEAIETIEKMIKNKEIFFFDKMNGKNIKEKEVRIIRKPINHAPIKESPDHIYIKTYSKGDNEDGKILFKLKNEVEEDDIEMDGDEEEGHNFMGKSLEIYYLSTGNYSVPSTDPGFYPIGLEDFELKIPLYLRSDVKKNIKEQKYEVQWEDSMEIESSSRNMLNIGSSSGAISLMYDVHMFQDLFYPINDSIDILNKEEIEKNEPTGKYSHGFRIYPFYDYTKDIFMLNIEYTDHKIFLFSDLYLVDYEKPGIGNYRKYIIQSLINLSKIAEGGKDSKNNNQNSNFINILKNMIMDEKQKK